MFPNHPETPVVSHRRVSQKHARTGIRYRLSSPDISGDEIARRNKARVSVPVPPNTKRLDAETSPSQSFGDQSFDLTATRIIDGIYIGNYESLTDQAVQAYGFDVIVVAASNVETGGLAKSKKIVFLNMTEGENEVIGPKLMTGAQFIHDNFKGNQKVLIACMFGMNRSVSTLIAYLALYRDMNVAGALTMVKNRRPIADPMPRYLSAVKTLVENIKTTYTNWIQAYSISQSEFQRLFAVPTDNHVIYEGKYPAEWNDVDPLDGKIQNDLKLQVIPDKAKTRNNRKRGEHGTDLIDRNEKERDLLCAGYYEIPEPNQEIRDLGLGDKIELTQKFLPGIPADAYVNTANEALMGGGGTDLLIHTYAGESLKNETAALPNVLESEFMFGIKCLTGDAKITSGHNLKAQYIVHVVTPYLDDNGNTQQRLHIRSYKSVLQYIDGKNIRTMVIGPISTGYYGYPMLEATVLGLKAIRDFLVEHHNNVDKITLWMHNDTQHDIYRYLIDRMF